MPSCEGAETGGLVGQGPGPGPGPGPRPRARPAATTPPEGYGMIRPLRNRSTKIWWSARARAP